MKKLIVVLLVCIPMGVQAQTAKEIIKKVDDKMQGNSNRSVMRMTIVRPDWKREVTMKGWSLGRQYSLILITAPARDKGQAFLKRHTEMWNWQPSIDRVIKLPPSMMLQSWMGSDFTNDDLVKESSVVEDYIHTLKQDTTIGGRVAYQIEMIPRPDAAVVWGKVTVFVDKAELNQLLVRYYDEDGSLVNTMVLSDIKPIGGRVLPCRLEMIPSDNPKQKTVIEYLDLEFDLNLEEDFFSMQNMKRVR
ncbi:MAG: outer membrane lipoprotein-sorting protein [Cyclobacteriaceae bacterium]|nr:outer membrane lipoprotein-sorting protein [Cyclobacteriaceae bacterium]MDH4297393.1 outer membrane lipoprotein-sorting protein [Cyclobacteriaceae bacterium]MDH5248556.1 outer membrane lipoprotein-sorting protein [Cyclobacteriaceae bacterium]